MTSLLSDCILYSVHIVVSMRAMPSDSVAFDQRIIKPNFHSKKKGFQCHISYVHRKPNNSLFRNRELQTSQKEIQAQMARNRHNPEVWFTLVDGQQRCEGWSQLRIAKLANGNTGAGNNHGEGLMDRVFDCF